MSDIRAELMDPTPVARESRESEVEKVESLHCDPALFSPPVDGDQTASHAVSAFQSRIATCLARIRDAIEHFHFWAGEEPDLKEETCFHAARAVCEGEIRVETVVEAIEDLGPQIVPHCVRLEHEGLFTQEAVDDLVRFWEEKGGNEPNERQLNGFVGQLHERSELAQIRALFGADLTDANVVHLRTSVAGKSNSVGN